MKNLITPKQESILRRAEIRQCRKKKMAKAKAKHIHSFKKVDIGVNKSYVVFKCTIEDCSAYYPPALVLDRMSICPHCDEAFQIKQKHLQMVTPHCDACVDTNHWKHKEKSTKVEKFDEVAGALAALVVKHAKGA